MSERLWILGAADAEMAAIESLLRECGETITYATVDGQRVHPGNAYRHDCLDLEAYSHIDRPQIIAVECAGTFHAIGEVGGTPCNPDIRVDHHRQGDSGFGRPPEEFFEASSIGQVVAMLAKFDLLPSYDIPDAYVLTAAADHCLEAAYRGKCPGVNPDELMRWRVESRAAFQGRSAEEVMEDVESARQVLREAVTGGYHCGRCGYSEATADGSHCNHCDPFLADLRGESIPELPEAACREGIPFLASVTDRDGREKVVLQAAPPELVKRFIEGEIVSGLTDYYGDPSRGFAGGYV